MTVDTLSAPTRVPRSRRPDPRRVAQIRQLTTNLVRRDLKVRHRGTFLGMLWSLTNPLLIVGLYYVIFTYIVQAQPAVDVPRPDGHAVPFALYFFSGLIIWNVFGTSAQSATTSVVGSGYLLRKVYFPRAILPLSAVLSSLVTFAFEFAILAILAVAFVGPPGWYVLWLPVILAITAIMAYGAALFLAAITVFLRDVAHFIGVLLQLWFWSTPIVYSLLYVSKRPSVLRLVKLNPMTGVVVSFRNVVLLDQPPALRLLAYDLGFALVALAIGAWVFQRWQRLFAEIV